MKASLQAHKMSFDLELQSAQPIQEASNENSSRKQITPTSVSSIGKEQELKVGQIGYLQGRASSTSGPIAYPRKKKLRKNSSRNQLRESLVQNKSVVIRSIDSTSLTNSQPRVQRKSKVSVGSGERKSVKIIQGLKKSAVSRSHTGLLSSDKKRPSTFRAQIMRELNKELKEDQEKYFRQSYLESKHSDTFTPKIIKKECSEDKREYDHLKERNDSLQTKVQMLTQQLQMHRDCESKMESMG